MTETDKTVFVKVDDYERILQKLSLLNQHLQKATEQLDKLKDLKANEDKELEDWETEMDQMQERIEFITNILSKKE